MQVAGCRSVEKDEREESRSPDPTHTWASGSVGQAGLGSGTGGRESWVIDRPRSSNHDSRGSLPVHRPSPAEQSACRRPPVEALGSGDEALLGRTGFRQSPSTTNCQARHPSPNSSPRERGQTRSHTASIATSVIYQEHTAPGRPRDRRGESTGIFVGVGREGRDLKCHSPWPVPGCHTADGRRASMDVRICHWRPPIVLSEQHSCASIGRERLWCVLWLAHVEQKAGVDLTLAGSSQLRRLEILSRNIDCWQGGVCRLTDGPQ